MRETFHISECLDSIQKKAAETLFLRPATFPLWPQMTRGNYKKGETSLYRMSPEL